MGRDTEDEDERLDEPRLLAARVSEPDRFESPKAPLLPPVDAARFAFDGVPAPPAPARLAGAFPLNESAPPRAMSDRPASARPR